MVENNINPLQQQFYGNFAKTVFTLLTCFRSTQPCLEIIMILVITSTHKHTQAHRQGGLRVHMTVGMSLTSTMGKPNDVIEAITLVCLPYFVNVLAVFLKL